MARATQRREEARVVPAQDHEAHVGGCGPFQNVGDFRGWSIVVQVGVSVY